MIDETYDNSGALTSKRYPSGRTYTYTNDGYGRPTGVSFGATAYLWNGVYHPNDKIHQILRGTDGGEFRQFLNARQLVSYVGGSWGTDMNYAHDAAGRITSIDSPNNEYDRTFTYDGVGRLRPRAGLGETGLTLTIVWGTSSNG